MLHWHYLLRPTLLSCRSISLGTGLLRYDDEYNNYWVPGAWVRPPHRGYLWTPCYWGFSVGYYGFHKGYWGRNVGYYGGVKYGYGYNGSGYYGGRWRGNYFQYRL